MKTRTRQTNDYNEDDEVIRCRDRLETSQSFFAQGAYGFQVRPKSVEELNSSEDYDGIPLTDVPQQVRPASALMQIAPHQPTWSNGVRPPLFTPADCFMFNPSVPPPSMLPPLQLPWLPPPPAILHSINLERRIGISTGNILEQKLKIDSRNRSAAVKIRQMTAAEVPRQKEERCKYYMEGRCNKSDSCPFSHDFQPPKKVDLCKYYANSVCRNGDSCVYMHSEWPCRFFHLYHSCKKGLECKFSHKPITPEKKAMLFGTDHDSSAVKFSERLRFYHKMNRSPGSKEESGGESDKDSVSEDTDEEAESAIMDKDGSIKDIDAYSATKDTDEEGKTQARLSSNAEKSHKSGTQLMSRQEILPNLQLGKRPSSPSTKPAPESVGPGQKKRRRRR